jgi:hypothetical protein
MGFPGTDAPVLTPSTPFAYPQVVSRTFASSISAFLQVTAISVAGSIPGSSTSRTDQRSFRRFLVSGERAAKLIGRAAP